MIDDELKRATVLTALNDMVRRGSFSICTLDRCAEILGIQLRGSEAYKLLGALHCVDFAAMPPNVRKAVPELVRQCLNMEAIGLFEEAVNPPPKRSIIDRLLN